MANKKSFLQSVSQRRLRHFSDSFKIEKVREIEQGRTRVSEICKQYEVSGTNVYKWISKFGTMKTN
ncbi:transposase, partial [Aquirufa ecclesiirivi]